MIEFRVVSAQAQLETVLARFRSVTGAGIATGFCQDGLDVVQKTRDERLSEVTNGDLDRGTNTLDLGGQLGRTVSERKQDAAFGFDDLGVGGLEGRSGCQVLLTSFSEVRLDDQLMARLRSGEDDIARQNLD